MSHQEYIAKCDEEQLNGLVELANRKLAEIRVQGWVKLWVIGTDHANEGWFEDYIDAVETLTVLAKRNAARGEFYGLRIERQKFRPDEAAELVLRSKPRIAKEDS